MDIVHWLLLFFGVICMINWIRWKRRCRNEWEKQKREQTKQGSNGKTPYTAHCERSTI